jgi:hypothetical protein
MKIINKTPNLRNDVTLTVSISGSYQDRLEVNVETKYDTHTANDYHCLEIPCNLDALTKEPNNESNDALDTPIRLYIEGKYLCDRLSINEWNALFSRYENDLNSKIIDHIDDTEHKLDYAIIETTLSNVLSKGAIMDLQFIRAIKVGNIWKTECLH